MNNVLGVQSIAEKISKFTLSSGSHKSSETGMCIMEAVSYIAGEEFSSHPICACPVITEFMISFNDILPDNATRDRWIKPLIPAIVNSRVLQADGFEDEGALTKRALVAGNAALRWFIPLELDMVAGYFAECEHSIWIKYCAELAAAAAATLRALPEQTTFESLGEATQATYTTLIPIVCAGPSDVAISYIRVDLSDLTVYARCKDTLGISLATACADLATRIDISDFSGMITHADQINEARVKVVLEMLAVRNGSGNK